MSDNKPIYELAFHISSNLDEASIYAVRQDIEKSVTSHGGAISFSRDLERVRLAYPIKRQPNTYFGYLNFNLDNPELMAQIRDDIRHNPNVLRFLLLKLQEEPKKKKEDLIRRIVAAERRRSKALKGVEKSGVRAEAPKMDKETEKELEEKLEEIIEKL